MRNNVHTVNSRNDFSHNDSTINIVKAIIIIINAIRYDTICYFNVRSKAEISQLNLPQSTILIYVM